MAKLTQAQRRAAVKRGAARAKNFTPGAVGAVRSVAKRLTPTAKREAARHAKKLGRTIAARSRTAGKAALKGFSIAKGAARRLSR